MIKPSSVLLLSAIALGACATTTATSSPASASPSQQPDAPQPSTSGQIEKVDLIRMHTPTAGEVVQSSLHVSGEARGTWFFEATFPITVLDANGGVLVKSFAQAQGEWMTEGFVPFVADLTLVAATTSEGTLVLEKSNPSGLPEHADALRIPIRFR